MPTDTLDGPFQGVEHIIASVAGYVADLHDCLGASHRSKFLGAGNPNATEFFSKGSADVGEFR